MAKMRIQKDGASYRIVDQHGDEHHLSNFGEDMTTMKEAERALRAIQAYEDAYAFLTKKFQLALLEARNEFTVPEWSGDSMHEDVFNIAEHVLDDLHEWALKQERMVA